MKCEKHNLMITEYQKCTACDLESKGIKIMKVTIVPTDVSGMILLEKCSRCNSRKPSEAFDKWQDHYHHWSKMCSDCIHARIRAINANKTRKAKQTNKRSGPAPIEIPEFLKEIKVNNEQ